MKKSIENFFDWKTGKGNSVEKQHQYHKIVSQWERTDVLYSFIGIYQIGLFVFYPDKCKRTKYTIKDKTNQFLSTDYLKERFAQFKKLNEVIIDSQFIQHIDSVGNVIPIWPGGNVDRGARAYCFDIPDIYFKRHEKWFLALQQLYPNSYLNGIIDSEFATDDTSIFLDSMNERRYLQFLEHIVAVIVNRTECLNNIQLSTHQGGHL